jgi:hypothetical protein
MSKKPKRIRDLQHTLWFVLFMQLVIAGGATYTLITYLNEIAELFLRR